MWDLIKLGGADTGTQKRIGDLIFRTTARGGQLPSVEDVRRRLGLGVAQATLGEPDLLFLDVTMPEQEVRRALTYAGDFDAIA